MKKLFVLLLMLLCAVSAHAEDFSGVLTEGIYEYRLVAGGAEITWIDFGEKLPATLVVPQTLGGQPVVGAGHSAFNTFEYGWEECIQYIQLPEGLMYLKEGAFTCCHNASVVLLPASLQSIPENCFHHFGGEIVLHADNPYFSNDQGFLVDVGASTLLYASPSANGRAIPPVRRLGAGCMQYWYAEDDCVFIPEGVEEIGTAALYDTWYEFISLPESLRLIEDRGLMCYVGQPVEIPAGCTRIGEDALPMIDDAWDE